MSVHYLEIVTNDVAPTCALYERLLGVSFGPPDSTMGQSRIAEKPDGALIGIREPLADHEGPIVRAYVAVEDIHAAATAAAASGAMVAYGPTEQGGYGTFAIVIHHGVQHGLWQR